MTESTAEQILLEKKQKEEEERKRIAEENREKEDDEKVQGTISLTHIASTKPPRLSWAFDGPAQSSGTQVFQGQRARVVSLLV